jgi:hypothetical protein
MQSAITNQPRPFNLAIYRRARLTRLPTYQRSNPYLETTDDHLA